ncbi:MAG: D-alanyl-D-alanine carboxypeptidase [Clostridia bacterium]|jgi:D-alanyl-D-alanine carboxypeptidase (penicillin-binding protein 5/6)|nr:D-alanyl-D-alanine carboxypeptidase [Clostridia bacterium]
MKKLLFLSSCIAGAAISLSALGTSAITAKADEALAVKCKSAYLCDYDSGTVVYSMNETERLPIASMCKIMTLLLSFEAADEGKIAYDEQVPVSENASSMGGSQVFLQTGLTYSAEQLMKSVAVCSANDSCVALAERIAGSESAFVDRMNARAKELGAENTLFANCTGLPKEPQYSCAKDVATMLREMLTHKKYYEFSKVWLEDFAHPDGRTTSMTNTNKLIRFYEGCDGGKTGFTNQAGFCLAATAKRGDTRLVSVVIGSDSSAQRFADTKAMFNHAFANYESKRIFTAGEQIGQQVRVRGSKVTELPVYAERTVSVFGEKGNQADISVQISLPDELKAPVTAGQNVGEAVVYRGGVEVARTALQTVSGAERQSWRDALKEGARNWN